MELDLEDGDGVRRALREIEPDEVYHLASASFVPASWDDPVATSTAAVASISALLDGVRRERPEALRQRRVGRDLRCAGESPQTERTPVAPLTPYGAGKAFGHFLTWLVPPSVRASRLVGDPLQPRVAAAIDAVPHEEGHPRRGRDQPRDRG